MTANSNGRDEAISAVYEIYAAALRSEDPAGGLEELEHLIAVRNFVEMQARAVVVDLRSRFDVTWYELGNVYGITRQAMQQKMSRPIENSYPVYNNPKETS